MAAHPVSKRKFLGRTDAVTAIFDREPEWEIRRVWRAPWITLVRRLEASYLQWRMAPLVLVGRDIQPREMVGSHARGTEHLGIGLSVLRCPVPVCDTT